MIDDGVLHDGTVKRVLTSTFNIIVSDSTLMIQAKEKEQIQGYTSS